MMRFRVVTEPDRQTGIPFEFSPSSAAEFEIPQTDSVRPRAVHSIVLSFTRSPDHQITHTHA